MVNPTTNPLEYWDRYAQGVTSEADLGEAFGWTQWDGHGPGVKLLGEPTSALELGCGRGVEVASLAREGVKAEGIDLSPVQVNQARGRWEPLGARFHQGGALEFLGATEQRWDAIYSVWGGGLVQRPERTAAAGARQVGARWAAGLLACRASARFGGTAGHVRGWVSWSASVVVPVGR